MLIAQISDLHLRTDGSLMHGRIDTRAALANCVAHVNGLNPRPDLVLATGDLVDLALPEDYPALRAMLDRLTMPVYVIPGNHDDRETMRASFGDLGYLPANGPFLHYTIENYPLRLIGLDTVLPGEVSGGLCPSRLHWLADRLAEQPDRPTLIFMHHPPFASGIAFLDRPPFERAAETARLVGEHRQVRQVICGHIHRAIHLNWAGTCAAVAPSTVYQMNLAFDPDRKFSATDDPPAISLYRWRDGLGPVGYVSLIGREPAYARSEHQPLPPR
jgi:3',5'-cyclic-AMP phosphodiesterase